MTKPLNQEEKERLVYLKRLGNMSASRVRKHAELQRLKGKLSAERVLLEYADLLERENLKD